MTLLFNVLNKDFSLLAADRRGYKLGQTLPDASGQASIYEAGHIVNNLEKIGLYLGGRVAVGIAGQTQHHDDYFRSTDMHVSVNAGLRKIRMHMEEHLRIDDRNALLAASHIDVEQSIFTFFDEEVKEYFSNTFTFSPIESCSRLYKFGTNDSRLFAAGSGSQNYEDVIGATLASELKRACSVENCIPLVREAYLKVSASDVRIGNDPMIVVSTRSNPQFVRVPQQPEDIGIISNS